MGYSTHSTAVRRQDVWNLASRHVMPLTSVITPSIYATLFQDETVHNSLAMVASDFGCRTGCLLYRTNRDPPPVSLQFASYFLYCMRIGAFLRRSVSLLV